MKHAVTTLSRIILTQKGQVQGAQAQALAGKIINTSQVVCVCVMFVCVCCMCVICVCVCFVCASMSLYPIKGSPHFDIL